MLVFSTALLNVYSDNSFRNQLSPPTGEVSVVRVCAGRGESIFHKLYKSIWKYF